MLRFLCLLLSSSLVSAGGDDGFVPLLRGAIDLTYDTLQGKVVSPWGTNFKFNPGFQFEVTNRGPFGPNNIYLETNKFSQVRAEVAQPDSQTYSTSTILGGDYNRANTLGLTWTRRGTSPTRPKTGGHTRSPSRGWLERQSSLT